MSSSARCIVCGRELDGDDPLVCTTCPRPAVDGRALPPRPGDPPPDPASPAPAWSSPGRLPGMAARPRAGPDELAPWETIGLGFAASALATFLWYQLGVAVGSLVPIAAIAAGGMIGAAFSFDARHRMRPLFASAAGLCTLTVAMATTYLIQRWSIARFDDGIDLVLPFGDVTDLIWTSIEEQPTMLIPWVIGVVLAIRLPAAR